MYDYFIEKLLKFLSFRFLTRTFLKKYQICISNSNVVFKLNLIINQIIELSLHYISQENEFYENYF